MDAEFLLVIEKMKSKRKVLLDKAGKVTAAIAALEEIFEDENTDEEDETPTAGDPRPSPARTNSNMPGPFAGMTVHAAAIRVLKAHGCPLKTRFIANELANGGVESTGMYRAVYNSLSQSESAVLADKQWKLREWARG